ncbi:MAG: Xaa-Pro peptidase family protein [Candidatus Lokiarchaeota archaeon]
MSSLEFNFNSRIQKVKNLIKEKDLDYILITNLQNLYWLSASAQYGILLISESEDPILFVRRNFFKAKEESFINNILELEKTSQIRNYLKKGEISFEDLKIGMELDSLPASFYLYYKNLFKNIRIENVELELRRLRMIKDKKELEIFREAGQVVQKTQEIIPKILRKGVKEYEVAAEIMHVAIKNKSVHFSNVNATFGKNWFILASGKNLWTPSYFPILSGGGISNAIPYGYSEREIQKGDMVMCDFAINYKGYHADHARTYYVEEMPNKFKERYLILKNVYLEVVEQYLRSGTPVNVLYNKMRQRLGKYNLGKYFEGDGYYYQGLGHGIGLELDEPPAITSKNNTELQENMVIALEPKIIIPDWGAIDLEDDWIIKRNSAERITNTEYLF